MAGRLLMLAVLGVLQLSWQSEIPNKDPRRDVNGTIMDVHDGNMIWLPFAGLYAYYGASYGLCKVQSTARRA